MGSLFRMPFMQQKDWPSYMEWLKQNSFHSYALAQGGKSLISEVKFSNPRAIWVGAEGSGLPEGLVQACDEKVGIPMCGQVESLNVGVAASLALFWASFNRPVS
jgi:tRNA G18 (ribose-2'-O)-methylase SpoU